MSRFVARHKQDWEELERLLAKRDAALRGCRPRNWGAWINFIAVRPCILRGFLAGPDDHQLEAYLNQLTAAAHSFVYLPPRKSILSGIGTFVTEGFARSVWRNGRAHLLSVVLLLVGGLLGYWVSVSDPVLAHAVWPAADDRQPGSSQQQLLEVLRSGRDDGGGEKFAFASMLFQHNFKVGLLAMGAGVLAGVPTVLLMGFNGMLLGAFVAIHHNAGIASEMWAWILPHGITEIGAIALCGGVGLMLGRAVLDPGSVSRLERLKQVGAEAARTCAGVGLMLFAAAAIESYVRQSHWSTNTRLLFAAATGVFWAAYFARGAIVERRARKTQDSNDLPTVPAAISAT